MIGLGAMLDNLVEDARMVVRMKDGRSPPRLQGCTAAVPAAYQLKEACTRLCLYSISAKSKFET